jgi:hypothetical protein
LHNVHLDDNMARHIVADVTTFPDSGTADFFLSTVAAVAAPGSPSSRSSPRK